MFARPFIAAMALVPAVLLSQAPEFLQQYGQRLGGAVDELQRIVAQFDEDSRRSGYDRTVALRLMSENSERLVRDQASRMQANIVRLSRLREQQDAFRDSGPVVRLASFVSDFDWPLAQRTVEVYKPAMPLTIEGVLFAAVGFFVPYWLMVMGAESRRRRRLRAQPRSP